MPIPILGGVIGAVGDFFGSIFAGKPEDTSAAGFNAFIQQRNMTPIGQAMYPTRDFVVAAAASSGMSADNVEAIRKTYDQKTGTGSKGDWKFAISSMNPLTIEWFKGASEHNQNVLTSLFPASNSASDKAYIKAQDATFANYNEKESKSLPMWAWVLIAIVPGAILLYVLFLIIKRLTK